MKNRSTNKKANLLIACSVATFAFAFLVGCQPQIIEGGKAGGGEEDVQIDFEWSADSSCSTCHKDQHSQMTSWHGDLGCVSCHTDSSALGVVHEGASFDDRMPSRLKKTAVENETCVTCHADYPELAGLTVGVSIFTDDNGTCVNPHTVVSEHEGEGHQTIGCASCHDEHAEEVSAEAYQAVCRSCHHMNVYECGTCH